jgi:gluconokinase
MKQKGPLVIILMGVSGAGKTTIGKYLAEDLGWPFYDGDTFHPRANIDKMSQGIPLTDGDRGPWLSRLRNLITKLLNANEKAVLTCSALKKSYRDSLKGDREGLRIVYLKGDHDMVQCRLQSRKEHFFDADLLASQFNTLEEPEDVLTVDASQDPGFIMNIIKKELKL